MNEKFFDLKSEKQERMINASLQVFALNGYKHASTDEIVKTASISKGLLFHYFDSKQGLYTFLADYSIKYFLYEMSRTVGDEKDYFSFMKKLYLSKCNVMKSYPYMCLFIKRIMEDKIFEDGEDGTAESRERYESSINKYRDVLSKPVYKPGVEAGRIQKLIELVAEGLIEEYLKSERADVDNLYRQIGEYIEMIGTLAVI